MGDIITAESNYRHLLWESEAKTPHANEQEPGAGGGGLLPTAAPPPSLLRPGPAQPDPRLAPQRLRGRLACAIQWRTQDCVWCRG